MTKLLYIPSGEYVSFLLSDGDWDETTYIFEESVWGIDGKSILWMVEHICDGHERILRNRNNLTFEELYPEEFEVIYD